MPRVQEVARIIKLYEDTNKVKARRGGTFTKRFKDFNKRLLINGDTNVVAFDKNKLFNLSTQKFIKKSGSGGAGKLTLTY